ncbi:hypothetical protein BKA70DRAFT_1565905 [Coprinopsis sp. MPI-PUGE-AT-0042]|nr:hypothetical protein BKA70DRAFT_1565905 [Coprinopsis sp. MPI-PUGE-AT-0042]
MTFATLRAIHTIMGDALDDIERVYHAHRRDTVVIDGAEDIYGDCASEPTAPGSPHPADIQTSSSSSTSISKAYVSPPPSPCVATNPNQSHRPSMGGAEQLDFPSLDEPCDPNSQAEMLTSDPRVLGAINRIIAGCGQMAAMVQNPFLTICDSSMAYHLPSCMRIVEAAHVVEILRESGADGLHVDALSERCGIEASKLAHILRLLATHHIFRELSPNVFASNRISSLMDSGKSLQELNEYRVSGRPEQKYQGSNGIAAFVGLCTDEINKSSAYMTEAYLLANSPKVRRANDPTLAPFCVAFGTAHLGVDYFGWLEGETIRSRESNSSSNSYHTSDGIPAPPSPPTSPNTPSRSNPHHQRASSFSQPDHKRVNRNRFRLERFGKAMSGTGSWEAPGAIFNALDWTNLPRGSIIVDVGGGIGSTSMLLASAFSSSEGEDLGLKFIIQDRSVVVEMGEKAWREKCPEFLDSGIASFQVHDFFTPQPIRNASIFLLRVVLHDWPDDHARRILAHLREAAAPDTKLLLADFVLPLACAETLSNDSGLRGIEGARSALAPAPLLPNLGKASANVYWMDLTMNVMFNSQERTLREIVALARSAGWKVVRVTQSPGSLFGHIVAVPIPNPAPRQGSRSRKTSMSAIPTIIHSPPSSAEEEDGVQRFGKPKEEGRYQAPAPAVSRASSLRSNAPTFGSKTELWSFKDVLTRLGGGVRRRRVSGLVARQPSTVTLSKTPSGQGPPERPVRRRPTPLTVFPPSPSTSRLPLPISPHTRQEGGGLRKTIKKHVSLASLRSSKVLEPEPTPVVPPLPEQLPTPITPTYYTSASRLWRPSSHAHLRQSSASSSVLPPGNFPSMRTPVDPVLPHSQLSRQGPAHSPPTPPAQARIRCYSTSQVPAPQSHIPILVTGRGSPPKRSRTGILRFDKPVKRMEDTRSFSPEIPESSGSRMSSMLARFRRSTN